MYKNTDKKNSVHSYGLIFPAHFYNNGYFEEVAELLLSRSDTSAKYKFCGSVGVGWGLYMLVQPTDKHNALF